jgi:hypothetical protein
MKLEKIEPTIAAAEPELRAVLLVMTGQKPLFNSLV